MAESIGEAYIRVLADGGGLPNSIRDEFRDHANPELKKIGEEGAKSYEEGYDQQDKEYARKLAERHLRDTVKDEQAQSAARQRIFRQSAAKLLADERKNQDYLKRLRSNSLRDAIQANVRANRAETLADRKAAADRAKIETAAAKSAQDYITRLRQKSLHDAIQANIRAARQAAKDQEKIERDSSKRIDKIVKDRFDALSKLSDKFAKKDRDRTRSLAEGLLSRIRQGDHAAISELDDLARRTDSIVSRSRKGVLKLSRASEDGVRDVGKLEGKLGKIMHFVEGNDFGKFFGQGSRNNFVNAFGNIIGILVRGVAFATIGLAHNLLSVGNSFRAAWKAGDTFGRKVKNVFDLVSTAVKKGAGAIVGGLVLTTAAIGGAVGLLQVLAGPLIAGIDDLLGLVVALASNIAFGLVGAVAALASGIGIGLVGALGAALPLMGSLALAAGVIGLAFAGMNKQQKAALKIKLKPLVDQFHQLQQAVRKGLFYNLDKQVPLFARVLKTITPLLHGIGRAVSDVATRFSHMLLSPGVRRDLQDFTTFIPNTIRRLGAIGAVSLRGWFGVFRALLPVSNKLLGILNRSAHSFANFTGSKQGQLALTTFFLQAFHTARLLGGALINIGKSLGDILAAGRHIGNDLLKNIGDSFGRLHDFFQTPRGSAQLQSFLTGAWKSAKILWNTLAAIATTIGTLLVAAKPLGDFLVKTIGTAFDKLNAFLQTTRGKNDLSAWMTNARNLAGYLVTAVAGLGKLWSSLDNAQSQSIINSLLKGIGVLADFIAKLVPMVAGVIAKILPYISRIASSLLNLFKTLEPIMLNIGHILGVVLIAGFRVFGPIIANLINWLSDFLKFLDGHGHIASAFGATLVVFWAAWKGYKIVSTAVNTVLIALGRLLLKLDAMAAAGGIRAAFANLFVGTGAVTSRMRAFFSSVLTGAGNFITRLRNMSLLARGAWSALLGGAAGFGIGSVIGSHVAGTGGKVLGVAGGIAGGAAIGSFFGPEGTVIGGAAGGITGLIGAWHAQSAAAQASADSVKAAMARERQAIAGVTQALIGVNGQYTNAYRNQIALQLSQKGVLGKAQSLGINVKLVPKAVLGSIPAQNKISSILQRQLAAVPKFSTKFLLPGGAGFQTAAEVRASGRSIKEAIQTTRSINPVYAALMKRQDDLMSALGLTSSHLQAGEHQWELYAKSIDKSLVPSKKLILNESDLSKAFKNTKQSQFGASSEGERNVAMVKELAKRVGDYAVTQAAAGRTTKEATAAYHSQIASLRAHLIAIGLDSQGVDTLLGKYKKVPTSVSTKLQAIDFATSLINQVHGLLDKIPKKHLSQVLAHVSGMNDLQIANYLLNHLPRYKSSTVDIITRYSTYGTPAVGGGRHFTSAVGRIVNKPITSLLGEAGPEAVVPLNRPLSQVDPSVRALSAFAQGIPYKQQGMANDGNRQYPQKVINVAAGAISVTTPTADAKAVAEELLAGIAAKGYI